MPSPPAVGGDEDLELTSEKPLLELVALVVSDGTFEGLDAEPGVSELTGEPAGSVGELGKDKQLALPRCYAVLGEKLLGPYPLRGRADGRGLPNGRDDPVDLRELFALAAAAGVDDDALGALPCLVVLDSKVDRPVALSELVGYGAVDPAGRWPLEGLVPSRDRGSGGHQCRGSPLAVNRAGQGCVLAVVGVDVVHNRGVGREFRSTEVDGDSLGVPRREQVVAVEVFELLLHPSQEGQIRGPQRSVVLGLPRVPGV